MLLTFLLSVFASGEILGEYMLQNEPASVDSERESSRCLLRVESAGPWRYAREHSIRERSHDISST